MAEPIKDLIERFVRGRDIPIRNDLVFDGHLNVPDITNLDKTEKEMFAKGVRNHIKQFQGMLADAKEKEQENVVAQLQQRIAELEKMGNPADPTE